MVALRKTLLVAALGAVYFLSAQFGLAFFSPLHPIVAAVWPPTGVAIAALLMLGRGIWPGVFLGAFAINVLTTDRIPPALAIAVGNTLEAVVAATLVERFAGGRDVFDQANRIVAFAALVAAGTLVSASFGVATLLLGGDAPTTRPLFLWSTWWLADTASAIVITPLLVLWSREARWMRSPRRAVEAAALAAATVLLGLLAFVSPALGDYPPAFLFLPLLGWATFRFGAREVATVVALLSLIAGWGTVQGYGPFVRGTPNESLLVLQAFMILVSLCTLPIAALVAERRLILERERAARAAAEAANASKDAFLAMLGHELRNPLAAVTAAAAVLQHGATGSDAERWHQSIARQTEHLKRLIDDLLDVARITSGKLTVNREPVDLGAAATRAVQGATSVGFVPDRRAVELDTRSVWILGDPGRIHQIVTNLVGNALKYTPAQGRIRVGVHAEGDDAVLRVEDEGIGIPQALLPRIFDPFTQGEQGLARSGGGLGIGLALVRRLVELHDGSVDAHSEGPGRGSVFVVRLPRIETPLLAPRTHDAVPGAGGAGQRAPARRHCILLVEDNPDARDSMTALLELLGHEVRTAADGEAAVATALHCDFDLALVDIGLPRLDGYEVARRVRAAKPHAVLVSLSGYGAREDEERSREAGFDHHLVKPVDVDELRRRLDSLLA